MSFTVDLPADIERRLRARGQDLSARVRVAALIDLYRHGDITDRELRQALSLSRFEVDGLLKQSGVFLDQTPDDIALEAEGLARLRRGQ